MTRNSLLLSLFVCLIVLAGCQPPVAPTPVTISTSAPTLVPTALPQSTLIASLATKPSAPTAVPTAFPQPTLAITLTTPPPPAPTLSAVMSPTRASALPVYTYRVINSYPHDPAAFTQGLVYQDGIFYEGTGLRGQSTLRKVDLATGEVLTGVRLPDAYFGEGIAVVGKRLFQLTWQEHTGVIYDKDSFAVLGTWTYEGEGWGLTTDGKRLVMSDGTHELRFLDSDTLQETGRVAVFDEQGQPLVRLNELEFVEGEVWANIWQTDRIARINPADGALLGWIDLTGLLPAADRIQRVDVLNGIAFDPATKRVFVTGKWWPKLFEIELVKE